jgi:hypothetical protein
VRAIPRFFHGIPRYGAATSKRRPNAKEHKCFFADISQYRRTVFGDSASSHTYLRAKAARSERSGDSVDACSADFHSAFFARYRSIGGFAAFEIFSVPTI